MPDPVLLRPDEEPVSKVIATGVNLVVGLTNDRQISFQSGYEGDEDDSSIRERFARMMKLADYLKAVAEIPAHRQELVKLRKTLADFQEDFARLESEHPHQLAIRQVEIDEMKRLRGGERDKFVADMNADILHLQNMRQKSYELGVENFRKAGRQGSYVPRGADEANLKRIDAAIEQAGKARDLEIERWDEAYDGKIAAAEAELHRQEEERKQASANKQITIARYGEEIAAREQQLADCQAIVDGS